MKESFSLRHWTVPGFRANTFGAFGWKTCGAAVLAMITGNLPGAIEKRYRGNRPHFSARRLRAALLHMGWESKNIGPYGLSNLQNNGHWKYPPWFFEQCVFILGAWTTKTEQSWFLFHDNTVYHNGEQWTIEGAAFGVVNNVTDIIIVRKKQ